MILKKMAMKISLNTKQVLLIISSALLISITYKYFIYYTAWISLIPFFFLIDKKTKRPFLLGYIVGFIASVILFAWMYDLAIRYTQTDTQIGLLLILISSTYYSIWFGIFAWIYSKIIIPNSDNQSNTTVVKIVSNTIMVSIIWVSLEWINTNLVEGIPWLAYNMGFTQSTNLYMIQLASIGSVWAIGFVVVSINYLLYISIETRKLKYSIYAISTLIITIIYGYISVDITGNKRYLPTIKVAAISENVIAEDRWTDDTGEKLQNIFYELNKEATKENPNLIVWSEAAAPWVFETGNNFFINILKITQHSSTCHLMGLSMPDDKDTAITYNSSCFFQPDGAITARYDKQSLLKYIERPFITDDIKIPFFNSDTKNGLSLKQYSKPLNTPVGKIGVIICNESILPKISREHVVNGAQYLILQSNDSWFEDNTLDFQHFYIARLRAVENRRDLLINSNRGYSGKISASGVITKKIKINKPNVLVETIQLRNNMTYFTGSNHLLTIFFIIFISIFFYKYKIKK